MSNFRVTREETHRFKKDILYVLAFVDGENYGIDVNNSTENFGRVILEGKENAEYLFNSINEFIKCQNDYPSACENVNSVLSYEEYDKIIFCVHTYRRHIEKLEAYALMRMLGFKFEERIFNSGMSNIKVKSKESNSDFFGEFLQIPDTGKFLFHFF